MVATDRSRPDPYRARLLRSTFEISALSDVVEAISVATEVESRLYVERFSTGWRWSLVHAGGGYPLLRIAARFLDVDYHTIQIGFRTVGGVAIRCAAGTANVEPADPLARVGRAACCASHPATPPRTTVARP